MPGGNFELATCLGSPLPGKLVSLAPVFLGSTDAEARPGNLDYVEFAAAPGVVLAVYY